jgi:hypothetical protein
VGGGARHRSDSGNTQGQRDLQRFCKVLFHYQKKKIGARSSLKSVHFFRSQFEVQN